jgi:hypothetical protein
MRTLGAVTILVLVAAPLAAVEVPFRDGSVVEAVSYTVTGSYIMLEMEGGSKVAFDVGDIDLEALRAAEAETAEPVPETGEGEATLGSVGTLQVPDETSAAAGGGLTITDQHVKHVRGSGIAGPEDEAEESDAGDEGPPEGYEEGGNVLLNNVSVSPLDGGQWQVRGEVVNRTAASVMDVRAQLQGASPDGEPWSASVPVSGLMGPDEKGNFSHTFSAPESAGDNWTPQVQVSVVWQRGETRLEPNYNRVAPHPSGLPVDRGGVGGADTVDGPTEPID